MEFTVVTSLEGLRSLQEEWLRLQGDNDGRLFERWAWHYTWCEQRSGDQENTPALSLVVARDKNETIAIVPLYKRSLFGPLRVKEFTCHRMSFSNDIVARSDIDEAYFLRILQYLRESLGMLEILHLRHLDPRSRFTNYLVENGYAEKQCARLYVENDKDISDQSARLSKSRRKTLRWARNSLRKQFGSCELRSVRAEGIETAFDTLLELHHSRFQSKEQQSLLVGSDRKFLGRVTTIFASSGNAEIHELVCGETVIASGLMFVDKGICYFIQSGFDVTYHKYSPIRLLLSQSIERAFSSLECSRFDFGPAYEDYKYDWKPKTEYNYQMVLGAPGVVSGRLANTYRRMFNKALPPLPSEGNRV